MAGPVYEVRGGRALRKGLREAGDDLTDLKTVHRAAAGVAAEGARARVPRRSNRLANTIRAAGTKTAGIVRVGNNTSVRYAGPIHWGWFRRHIKDNPFASAGAQATESRWVPLYEQYTDAALDKIKGT
ncbi:HK97 gp10 family phage protein [Labedella phragmitis]|uniref:HK97 gp10 family phage protein n=1 Tax=Labedella phragmitis TaxID=2498849 RepID=A0A3S4APC4_9MICO|nr:HK97 gp10 family phage protein [Labedella phragmitis]RWZ52937.1 HK97 gp10 family phage protein [Labedella phragmitis]